MNDDELERRIRRLVAEVAASAPPPPPFPSRAPTEPTGPPVPFDLGSPPTGPTDRRRRSRWRRPVAAAVAIVVLVGAVALVWSRGEEQSRISTAPVPTTGTPVAVRHEVLEYVDEGPETCTYGGEWHDGPRRIHVETWADPAADTWRQDLQGEDGSTQSQIDVGLNGVWRETFRNGAIHPAGCVDPALAPDNPVPYSLNTTQSGTAGTEMATLGAELVDDATTDSRGRPAQLWRATIDFSTPGQSVVSTTETFLDPTGSTVLERTSIRTVDGVIDSSVRLVLDTFEEEAVDASAFATDGYDHVRIAGTTPGTGVGRSRDQRSCFTASDLTQICLTREAQTVSVDAAGLEPGSDLTIGLNTGREQRSATLTVDESGRIPETDLWTVQGVDDRVWVLTAQGTHSSGARAGGLLSLGA